MFKFYKNFLYPYIRPYKFRVIGAIILSIILAGIGALQVRLVQPIFDNGIDANSQVSDIYFLALSLLALGILNFPCRFYHFYWIRFVVDRATCSIREDLFKKLQKLPISYFTANKQGELISTIVNDTQVFSSGFRAIIDLFREPLKALAYLGMAFYYDWQLTLVIFIIAPFLILIFSISGRTVKNNQGAVQDNYGGLTHNITEGISGQKLAKAFNLQDYIVKRFRAAQDKYFDSQMKTTIAEEIAHPFVELVGTIAFSAVIVFAYHRVVSAGMTKGTFIGFIAALALFMDPIRKFSQANVKLAQANAAADRIFALLKIQEERIDGLFGKIKFTKEIRITNLSFYFGDKKVIDNLSLVIPKGRKVALVGLSGSGKSTLINLLLGLYPIEKNKIFIDDKDITGLNLVSLREVFGLVSQDMFLFHDSIAQNLMLGKDFKIDEINHALEVSYANEFVDSLPEKIETIVGDRGSRLSGGQQQRITIARAFLQDTEVLLFDEATSALDNESEKVVQKALESIASEKTVVAVAHRLTSIQNYDMIYVMKEGRVVEFGHHEELISTDGEYKKLYQLSLS